MGWEAVFLRHLKLELALTPALSSQGAMEWSQGPSAQGGRSSSSCSRVLMPVIRSSRPSTSLIRWTDPGRICERGCDCLIKLVDWYLWDHSQ